MKSKSLLVLVGVILMLLILAGSALAMSSANYRLDWYVNMSGAGGGAADSTNYDANFTVGQVVVDRSSSAHYATGLGYWEGVPFRDIYFPVVQRNK
jgi:hypothetical protein